MMPRRPNSTQQRQQSQTPNGHHRARSARNPAPNGKQAQQAQQAQQQSQPPQQQQDTSLVPRTAQTPSQTSGMSLALRYVQNLKVLRRHDPTISSIIDQFSYVCIYQHDGTKWDKKGFEGSFFLFERRAYPPYGFFVLNRMGMEDYVQYLYPEDVVDIRGQFLLYRFYPELTARRLALARPLPPSDSLTPLETYTTVPPHTVPTLDDPLTNWKLFIDDPDAKGRAETIGLWMHEGGDRDVKPVLKHLHTFVKEGKRYPDQFRTTPDIPPDIAQANGLVVQPPITNGHTLMTNGVGGGINGTSELDKLFSKLAPSSGTVIPTTTTPASSDGKVTLADLFASASASTPGPLPSITPVPAPSSTPSTQRGIALLDSIFASATPDPVPPLQPKPPPPPPASHEIHSPKPAVAGLPQILTQDVIAQLLGMPSPAPSPAHHQSNDDDDDGMLHLPPPSKTKTNGVHVSGDATPRAQPTINGGGGGGGSRTGTPGAQRPLVPFHEDSALWPYPRAPLDDRESSSGSTDVVELDFSDTRALSDMDAFAAAAGAQQKVKESASGGKRKGRRAARREREKAEREAIEKTWDVPEPVSAPGPVQQEQEQTQTKVNGHAPASSSNKIDIKALFKASSERDVLSDTLASEVGKALNGPRLERKAFVREVLTLIHTDSSFVDKLYSSYLAATAPTATH